jgi:hypothetical protein
MTETTVQPAPVSMRSAGHIENGKPSRKRKRILDAPTDDSESRSRMLLAALTAFRDGDFSWRLPLDWAGTEGRIAETFNQVIAQEPGCTMQWAEEHGPKVSAPTRRGFGSLIMGPVLESALGGKVEIDFPVSGLIWKLSALVSDGLETRVAVV